MAAQECHIIQVFFSLWVKLPKQNLKHCSFDALFIHLMIPLHLYSILCLKLLACTPKQWLIFMRHLVQLLSLCHVSRTYSVSSVGQIISFSTIHTVGHPAAGANHFHTWRSLFLWTMANNLEVFRSTRSFLVYRFEKKPKKYKTKQKNIPNSYQTYRQKCEYAPGLQPAVAVDSELMPPGQSRSMSSSFHHNKPSVSTTVMVHSRSVISTETKVGLTLTKTVFVLFVFFTRFVKIVFFFFNDHLYLSAFLWTFCLIAGWYCGFYGMFWNVILNHKLFQERIVNLLGLTTGLVLCLMQLILFVFRCSCVVRENTRLLCASAAHSPFPSFFFFLKTLLPDACDLVKLCT